MVFAADHWDIFSSTISQGLLNKFQLSYVRLSSLPDGMTSAQLRTELLTIEKNLIREFVPACNSTHTLHTDQPKPKMISAKDIAKRLQIEMRKTFLLN